MHLFVILWVTLLTYWFWNVYLRKGQVFWANEIPVGRRISSPSKLQRCITWIPIAKTFSCVCLLVAVGTYEEWKDCNGVLAIHVVLGSVLSEICIHNVFLRVSSAWCILHNTLTLRQKQRYLGVLSLVYVTASGYHFGFPFFFTTLVMIYCSVLTLEFHNIVLNIRELKEALGEQIANQARRGTNNDVATALIEQMNVQLKLLVSFQKLLGAYLTIQIIINGPLYMFVRRLVALCIARNVLDLGVFAYFLWKFSECHVNAFPYVAFQRTPRTTGRNRSAEVLIPPEVWTYYSKNVSLDLEQLTNGDLYLGIPSLDIPEDEGQEDQGQGSLMSLSLVSNPTAVQYGREDEESDTETDREGGREREGGVGTEREAGQGEGPSECVHAHTQNIV